MPNFTKKAIKESFIKLLNEKPLSQISVRMIVEDCGINRNSFYYHYKDMLALIEEIVHDQVSELIAAYPTVESLDECVTYLFDYMVKNKKAIWHIYNSVNRDLYERSLMNICDYVVVSYLRTAFAGVTISESDLQTVVHFFKCEIFGLSFAWIMNGMKEDAVEEIHRITKVCRGLSDDLIRRIRENETC